MKFQAKTSRQRPWPRIRAARVLLAFGLALAANGCVVREVEQRGGKARRSAEFDPRRYYGRRALFVREGYASYYGDQFAGRRTANGEVYDPDAYTAAHRSLPFGTILRVTHEQNGNWVLVRVNDRGPYGPRTRVLDLSKQAARRLSMLRQGVAHVRLEILEMGQ